MRKGYFVSAIGTDSGKTVVSAILMKALNAEYWKPVQSGYPRDTETVQKLTAFPQERFHAERYLLKTPASPHASARIDGVEIKMKDFQLPEGQRPLVVEGAGGLMVPINDHDFILDLIRQFSLELILVSNLYLGNINHTLLSVEVLKKYEIPVKGIIFNGPPNAESQSIILKHSGYRELLHVLEEKDMNAGIVDRYADKLKEVLHGTVG
jgi:dethiobiotin synthetase